MGNKVLTVSATIPVRGNGIGLGLTTGTKLAALYSYSQYGLWHSKTEGYGMSVGDTSTSWDSSKDDHITGVTTDPQYSGLVAELGGISTFAPHFYIAF